MDLIPIPGRVCRAVSVGEVAALIRAHAGSVRVLGFGWMVGGGSGKGAPRAVGRCLGGDW